MSAIPHPFLVGIPMEEEKEKGRENYRRQHYDRIHLSLFQTTSML